jgi:hypothetical protein
MNHEQAHQILDKYRDGEQYSSFTINQALYLTGDIGVHERERGAGMDRTIQHQEIPSRFTGSEIMVVKKYIGD